MGYSHHWYRVETPAGPLPPEPPDAYGHLAFDALALIRTAAAAGIELADGTGDPATTPVVDEGGIWLNGTRPHDAETFAWPAQPGPEPWWTTQPGDRWWDACKTNREPYDAVVCAALIRAAHHYGPSIRISSDGAWSGAVRDGRHWPEWLTGRRLVVAVFGPDADTKPLTEP